MIRTLIILLQTGESLLFVHEKSYTAIVVVLLILCGLFAYMMLTNRRISRIEKELNRKNGGERE